MKRHGGGSIVWVAVVLASVAAGCSHAAASDPPKSITLYTSASANVEQAVITGFEKAHPGTKINVFRAATGPLNARVAADVRSGGIQADVIWASDPLTMYGYDKQGLLRAWTPPNASEIPSAYRTPHFTGIDVLYMVSVEHTGAPAPASWSDLADPEYKGMVAIPSPSFAASALGMLGYLTATDGYGVAYYRALKANGAVQVDSPTDTLTGVEQGTYLVGATLANAAYIDQKKGSPIVVTWPKPGGIAIYAPIGLTTKKHPSAVAEQFADYAASDAAQKLMADQFTYPAIAGAAGAAGPPIPAGSPIVAPDWAILAADNASVLAQYTAIFGS